LLESLRQKDVLYRSVNRNHAYGIAKDRHISKKSVSQFSVRIPKVAEPISEKIDITDETDYAKVFVGNVPYETSEDELAEVLKKIGEVVYIRMPINLETGRPRGYAFVEFEHNADAEQAINLSSEITLSGRRLYIQKYERLPHT
jgi:RNA recognition motif-containing protein